MANHQTESLMQYLKQQGLACEELNVREIAEKLNEGQIKTRIALLLQIIEIQRGAGRRVEQFFVDIPPEEGKLIQEIKNFYLSKRYATLTSFNPLEKGQLIFKRAQRVAALCLTQTGEVGIVSIITT